jgi:rRNA-processing protein FCF1
MKRLFLDTNFLVDVVKYKIDLDEIEKLVGEECSMLVVKPVLNELKKISSGKAKDSKFAKVALMVIKEGGVDILETEGKKADDAIVSAADMDVIAATNDIKLRKRLKILGVKTIYLRAKKHLAMG